MLVKISAVNDQRCGEVFLLNIFSVFSAHLFSLSNLHFSSSLLVSLSLHSLSLSVSIQTKLFIDFQSPDPRNALLLIVFCLCLAVPSAYQRRFSNSRESKTKTKMMSGRFHSQNKNSKPNEICNLFHCFLLLFGMMWERRAKECDGRRASAKDL